MIMIVELIMKMILKMILILTVELIMRALRAQKAPLPSPSRLRRKKRTADEHRRFSNCFGSYYSITTLAITGRWSEI